MQYTHIKQLSSEVIGQIAAGEVVERPAAAIKELVENSMDAGASAITVEIRDGGLTSFRVVDNGSGIQPSDIRLAFARHATSKIAEAKDLYGVQTLGFRGEALASIAAVAKVTCTTRTRGAESGISVQVNGGEMGEIREAACPEGTGFTVKDIFYNAPVRRKFMKKPSVETGYISDLMMRFILSHPQISFRYIADGKSVYFSAGDGKLSSAVMSVYGLNTLERLHAVSGNMNGLLLEGYVGVGDLSRGNRTHESFILNGRLIKSTLLSAAVEEGCRQRVMIGRFPMCILHLTLPFEATDVNVHPNKWEVRFQNETAIREAVQTLVQEALQGQNPLNAAEPLFEKGTEIKPADVKQSSPQKYVQQSVNYQAKVFDKEQKSEINIPYSKIDELYSKSNLDTAADLLSQAEAALSPDADGRSFSHLIHDDSAHTNTNILRTSQIPQEAYSRNAYSEDVKARRDDTAEYHNHTLQPDILSSENDTKIGALQEPIEQAVIHTAAENVPHSVSLDNEIEVPSVPVLEELPVRLIGVVFNTYILLECDDRLLLCDQHAVHERLLYEQMMRACAGDAAAQQLLVPEIVQLTHREFAIFKDSQEALLRAGFDSSEFGDLCVQLRSVPMVLGQVRSADCFRDALEDLAESGQISTQKRTDRIIQMACKHAVKGGERATMEALAELIRRMIRENVTPTCPHGRPLVIEITRRDLEKRFHRIQG